MNTTTLMDDQLARKPSRGMSAQRLPVVDMHPFLYGDEAGRQQVAGEIAQASQRYGFFYLTNHGIPQEVVAAGFDAAEAERIGLVNRVFDSREALYAGVREIALQIAAKSPLSIRGTKEILNHTRDHSVADGLQYMASWNAAMLMSQDLMTAMMASMAKQTPEFKD